MLVSSRMRHLAGLFRRDPLRAVERGMGLARAQLAFRGRQLGGGVSAERWVRTRGAGAIQLDSGITFVGGMVLTEVISHPGAVVHIGEGSVVHYGVSIEASGSIQIGRGCVLASFVRVFDRGPDGIAPVVIGDGVWLSHGVIVEPGVTIGSGSVISAGSVVRHDVPPGSLASGNPAVCRPLVVPAAVIEAASRANVAVQGKRGAAP